MKQHKKLARYLKGTAQALKVLGNEIEQDGEFNKESEELMCKIGANLLFHAKSYIFLTSTNPKPKNK